MDFQHFTFGKRVKTMLKVDFRRMFTMPLVYILIAACLVMPILILVMTTMMDGMESVKPQTNEVTIVEGFDNAWQILGSVSSDNSAAGMTGDGAAAGMQIDMLSMCNINMLYFIIAVLVCIFVAEDFRSGYAKNLFTVRTKKSDYVISKTIVCFVGGALMILAFFAGTVIGGAVAGLPFTMEGFNAQNVVFCVLTKVLAVLVFVPIYLIMSVVGKQKLWMSLLLSFMVGMFLFMMIPLLTPLDATPIHVFGCLAGGVLFAIGLGAGSNKILKKTSLV